MTDKWFQFYSADENEAVVKITTSIGGWFGIDAEEFVAELEQIAAPRLRLVISSGGGSVFAGNEIYNALLKWRAEVGGTITAEISGMAASMASIIAMAADDIQIYRNSFFMIHEAATETWGNAKDLERDAALLKDINENAVQSYLRHTNLSEETVRTMMSDETWINAVNSIEWGFAHTVIDEDAPEPEQKVKPVGMRRERIPEAAMVLMETDEEHEEIEEEEELTGDEVVLAEEIIDALDESEGGDTEADDDAAPVEVADDDDEEETEDATAWDEGYLAGVASITPRVKQLEGIEATLAGDLSKLTEERDEFEVLAHNRAERIGELEGQLLQRNKDLASQAAHVDDLNDRMARLLPGFNASPDTAAPESWDKAFAACKAKGMNDDQAYADVRKKYPDLYIGMMEEKTKATV